jgi:hypothetical protein
MTYVKEAEKLAHGLIQGYLGPDHKVRDMQSFYRALAQALVVAHQKRAGPIVPRRKISRRTKRGRYAAAYDT